MRGMRRDPTSTTEELVRFFALKQKAKVIKKPKPRVRFPYLKLGLDFKKTLIQLYYGSTFDFTTPRMR